MKIDLDRLNKQRELEGGSGRDFWKRKEGDNRIRLFPFSHLVSEADVLQHPQDFFRDEIGKKVTCLFRPVTQQWGYSVGKKPSISTPESLAHFDSLNQDPHLAEVAKNYRPRRSYFCNIVDTIEAVPAMQIYSMPKLVYMRIMEYFNDPENSDLELGGINGLDFLIKYNPKGSAMTMYSITLRRKENRVLPSDLEEQTKDFYGSEIDSLFGVLAVVPSAKGVFTGTDPQPMSSQGELRDKVEALTAPKRWK